MSHPPAQGSGLTSIGLYVLSKTSALYLPEEPGCMAPLNSAMAYSSSSVTSSTCKDELHLRLASLPLCRFLF